MHRHHTTTRSRLARLALAAGELARRLVGLPHVRAVYRSR
jgi:hypothetical protein